jgi:hypothetical protein
VSVALFSRDPAFSSTAPLSSSQGITRKNRVSYSGLKLKANDAPRHQSQRSTASQAIEAELAASSEGIVDRVVESSNGEYEVHNTGVSWPHHILVNQHFKVIDAD